ncbi:MAG: peptidoglycan editing factor PgeF [Candidatus Sulfotelmatobacter sp.]
MPNRVPRQAKLNVLRPAHLSKFPWLIHGFSTRVGGFSRVYGKAALNLGFTRDDSKATVQRNRDAFLAELGAKRELNRRWPLVTLRQVHSDIIQLVESAPESQLVGDGLITNTPGLLLAIQTADCFPIILVDPKRRALGVFHAGWRGTLRRIVEKGVGEMHRCFGTGARDLEAAIGPGIHSCCYEVGEEVRDQFESQFAYAEKLVRVVEESDPVREKYPMLFLTARAPGHSVLPKKIFLDLAEANRQQLLAVGVPAKSIEVSSLCTNCRTDLLFSYRSEKGKTGLMMGVVGIRG